MSAEYSVESLQHLILSQHASTSVEAIAALRAFQERIKADDRRLTDWREIVGSCRIEGPKEDVHHLVKIIRSENPPAQAAQETPCSLNEALAVIEAWADRGNRLDGDDAPRLRAIADRIAPTAEPVAQGEAEWLERLKDPETVHALMLRGVIAVPSIRSMVDLRGEVPNGDEVQLLRIAELQEQIAAHLAQPRAVPDGWRETFAELLEDYAGARAETAVWNVTQRLQPEGGIRMPRPRLAKLMAHVDQLAAAPSPGESA